MKNKIKTIDEWINENKLDESPIEYDFLMSQLKTGDWKFDILFASKFQTKSGRSKMGYVYVPDIWNDKVLVYLDKNKGEWFGEYKVLSFGKGWNLYKLTNIYDSIYIEMDMKEEGLPVQYRQLINKDLK